MKKIKNVLLDLSIPFKDFIHWNLSKFLIFISSIVIGFFSIIPILIIFYFLESKSSINWYKIYDILINNINNSSEILKTIYENNSFFFNIYAILMVIGIIIFIIFFNYSNILLAKLHLSYLEKKDFSITKNYYFNFSKIWKYFLITLTFLLYLLIPIIIFFIGFFIIILIFDVGENSSSIFSNFNDFNYFSSFSLSVVALLFFSILLFLYFIYRIVFSYIILIDDKNYELDFSANFYIKESFRLTNSLKKFFLFMFLFLLLLLILSPIFKIGNYIKSKLISNIKTINYSLKKIPILLPEKNIDKSKINIVKLNKETQKYTILYIFYSFVYFLIITGLINLFIVSFYRRFIIFDKKSIKHEKGISGNFHIKEKIKIVKIKKK